MSYHFRKAIEQREKEAEMIYKSESSDEEEQNKNESIDERNEQDKFHQSENSNASEKENTFNNPSNNNDSKSLECAKNDLKLEQDTLALQDNSCNESLESSIDAQLRNCISSSKKFNPDIDIANGEIPKAVIEVDLSNNSECQKMLVEESDTNSIIDCQSIKSNISIGNQSSAELNTETFENKEMTDLSLSVQDKKEVEKKENKSQACDEIFSDTKILDTGNTEEYSLRFSEGFTESESFSSAVENNQTHLLKEKGNNDSFNSSSLEFHKAVENKLNIILNGKEDGKKNKIQSEFGACPEKVSNSLENGYCKELTEQSVDKEVVNTEAEFDNAEEMRLNATYNFKANRTILNAPTIVNPETGIINFEDGFVKPGVNGLMERFYTHLSYKKKSKKKTPVELK